ncbi:MAG: hypothetical protein SFY96_12600 [Planctomycetota bacterium]|nr:hypothetical protein [Planctomycetota bacterium]
MTPNPLDNKDIAREVYRGVSTFIQYKYGWVRGSEKNNHLTQLAVAALGMMGELDGKPTAELLAIARNIATRLMIDEWRRKSVADRHAPWIAAELERRERDMASSPEASLEAHEEAALLERAIAECLPTREDERSFILEYLRRVASSGSKVPSLRGLSDEYFPERDPTKGCRVFADFVERVEEWYEKRKHQN